MQCYQCGSEINFFPCATCERNKLLKEGNDIAREQAELAKEQAYEAGRERYQRELEAAQYREDQLDEMRNQLARDTIEHLKNAMKNKCSEMFSEFIIIMNTESLDQIFTKVTNALIEGAKTQTVTYRIMNSEEQESPMVYFTQQENFATLFAEFTRNFPALSPQIKEAKLRKREIRAGGKT
jgi:hypothetical protein